MPIPVLAEMGSINPTVVTGAGLATRGSAIAEGLTAAVAAVGGQLCTKPGVVFVPDGAEGDAFARELADRLAAAEPEVLLNERLHHALAASVDRLPAEPLAAPGPAVGRACATACTMAAPSPPRPRPSTPRWG